MEVTRTERFKAQQSLMENRHDIIQLQVDTNKESSEKSFLKHKSFINFFGFLSFHVLFFQTKYQITRDEQKLRVQSEIEEMENIDLDDEEKLKE